MPAANQGKLFKITWGTAFANTLLAEYPLDKAVSYDQPPEGQEVVVLQSGVTDAWALTEHRLLEGDYRWIRPVDGGGYTGWDGATGVRAFLNWARQQNTFRFFPDAASGSYVTCVLVEPMQGAPAQEEDMTRSFRLRIRSTDGNTFTGY